MQHPKPHLPEFFVDQEAWEGLVNITGDDARSRMKHTCFWSRSQRLKRGVLSVFTDSGFDERCSAPALFLRDFLMAPGGSAFGRGTDSNTPCFVWKQSSFKRVMLSEEVPPSVRCWRKKLSLVCLRNNNRRHQETKQRAFSDCFYLQHKPKNYVSAQTGESSVTNTISFITTLT